MKLSMKLGLGAGHILLDGDLTPSPKGAKPPAQFSAHICCGQIYGWIKMPLRMEVGLGPGDFVFDGDPSSPFQKGAEYPFFGPCVLWPNGWMDQDGTWHGGGPQSRSLCARWGPPPQKKGVGAHPTPIFSYVYCGHGRPSQLLLSSFC